MGEWIEAASCVAVSPCCLVAASVDVEQGEAKNSIPAFAGMTGNGRGTSRKIEECG
jgi:hypothetical protein